MQWKWIYHVKRSVFNDPCINLAPSSFSWLSKCKVQYGTFWMALPTCLYNALCIWKTVFGYAYEMLLMCCSNGPRLLVQGLWGIHIHVYISHSKCLFKVHSKSRKAMEQLQSLFSTF